MAVGIDSRYAKMIDEVWQGKGWYTVDSVTSKKPVAFWAEDPEDIESAIRDCLFKSISLATIGIAYHGVGMIPDECQSPDFNAWCDFDSEDVTVDAYDIAQDIADAKNHNDMDAFKAALQEYYDYCDSDE